MRNVGLDVLKILAVVAVVLLHAIWVWPWADKISFVVLDQFLRFCVPMFVAISGYGLMIGYGRKLDLLGFLRKRLGRLLPWYLIVATTTILLVTFVWKEAEALYRGASVWKLYLLGQAYYHLYFVTMIIQLYLLFPVFLFLFKKIPPKILVLLVLIGQIWWYGYIGSRVENSTDNNSLWPDQMQYRYFISWVYYFVLGMFLAGSKKTYWGMGFVLCIVGLGLSIINSTALLTTGVNVVTALRFTRISILIFSTGVIFLGKALMEKLTVSPVGEKLLAKLANYSYLIYLWHPIALRVISRLAG